MRVTEQELKTARYDETQATFCTPDAVGDSLPNGVIDAARRYSNFRDISIDMLITYFATLRLHQAKGATDFNERLEVATDLYNRCPLEQNHRMDNHRTLIQCLLG